MSADSRLGFDAATHSLPSLLLHLLRFQQCVDTEPQPAFRASILLLVLAQCTMGLTTIGICHHCTATLFAGRELFEAWCEDPRNGVIIADFAVAGTLAREVLDEPKEVISHSGHKVSPGLLLSIRCHEISGVKYDSIPVRLMVMLLNATQLCMFMLSCYPCYSLGSCSSGSTVERHVLEH